MADLAISVRVVSQNRDFWDWALYVVTAAAALAALWGLLTWVFEQRKRPEYRFRWFRPSGDLWQPGDVLAFKVGTEMEYEVSVAVDNIGNGTADGALVNVIFPDFVRIWFVPQPGLQEFGAPSGDASVGLPPDYKVTFLKPERFMSTPGLMQVVRFRLQVLRDPRSNENPGPFHAAVVVDHPRLNVKGRRRIPVLVIPLEDYNKVPDPWPGKPTRRKLSMAKAEPEKSVRVLPGSRVDRRQFKIG